MKQFFRLSCAAVALLLVLGASFRAQAQPDPFVTQVSSSNRDSFVGGMSGNARFVVIESNGDISTEKTASRNNADGNREIFLFDYAQRRIFQITNTTSTRVDTTKPDFLPDSPQNRSNVIIEVTNNRPVISNNGRWIVFSSNALTPASFDGNNAANRAALAADGNQELFLYFVPGAPAAALESGADVAFFDLANGEFTRLTNTPASRVPTAGSATASPFVADDNRDASVNDNASVIAFVSSRDLTGANADGNPEVFIFKRNTVSPATGTFVQVTNTTGSTIFNENPSVSGLTGGSSTLAFISNANIPVGGASNNADANAEIYLASFDGTNASVTRQVTRTALGPANNNLGVNILTLGQRMSRDGSLLAFESFADLTGDSSVKATNTVFIYNVAANTFTQVGPRAAVSTLVRFPSFTDYNGAGQPATIIFSSVLNFTAAGALPTNATDGLNPNGRPQIFAAPVTAPITFTRLTDTPAFAIPTIGPPAIQAYTSETRRRTSFTLSRTEIGGGNSDNLNEAFYLWSPPATNSNGTLSFFTGASERPVTTPTPTAPAVAGLAPGMLGIVRSASALAPSAQEACPQNSSSTCASEVRRSPSLPVELNGVSLSINGAAAGLYSVAPGQINFVVPVGLAPTTGTATYPFVINNNGVALRGTIQILPAQPDIFTTTMGAGGRAVVFRVNAQGQEFGEPFTVPAVLRIVLTGVRGVAKANITVRIGTTDLTGAAILTDAVPRGTNQTPGFYQIDVQVPASLAGAGDVPVIVTVNTGGVTTSSRPAASAPLIHIN
ncbi:MAG TPA: hypothetical protein VGX92_13590 [Pyrinomonadaceae bacterium]|nr:hypothetical protein [Pyrinomonadaceae bacterium]